MAVHIFTNKSLIEGKEICDPELLFMETDLSETDCIIDDILISIDQCFYKNRYVFTDRFGADLYWDNLSTGSKALIAAYKNPDKIVDACELGLNAKQMIPRLTNGLFYFKNGIGLIETDSHLIDLYVNEKYYNSTDILAEEVD